ncbi:MAG: elongation factor G [Chloroflexota bacterium]|nr:elongation factor G [Chloroflexota bacterium]
MDTYGADRIRNVGFLGHMGAGKTTLAEAMLFRSSATSRMGRVEDGSTVSDYEPEEVKRGGSINLAVVPVEWQDHKLNILDTPGYADFVGEVVEAVHVVDSAVIFVEAVSGVQVGTEQVWQLCDDQGLPRVVVVSRLDRDNASFRQAVEQLREMYGTKVAAAQLPIGEEGNFRGVVDLISGQALFFGDDGEVAEGEVPPELQDDVEMFAEQLTETVAETDDDLVLKYLEGEGLTPEEVREGVKQGISSQQVIPVFVCAATGDKGVRQLLDALVALLPAAAETSITGTDTGTGKASQLTTTADGPLAARVFKTLADPFVGRLSYFRVYSGTFRSDAQVWNAGKEESERVGQVLMVRGKDQEPVSQVAAGDIGAVAKLAETATGDTISQREQPRLLPAISFPEPVYSVAVVPEAKSDLDRMSSAVARLQEEDLTLRVTRSVETAQTLLSGMGDSHIDLSLERIRRKFGASLKTEPVRVPYRETIMATASAEGRHVKQSGGHGQYGVCTIEVSPRSRGEGYEFVDNIVGGVISQGLRPAVDKGVREAMERGVLAGYPIVDVQVRLYDGKEHSVDSSEIAFRLAGLQAFQAAVRQAGLVLLEPIVQLEVQVPEANAGDIIADLNQKRARIQGMDTEGGHTTVITADGPQAEFVRYATDLRSITGGRASFKVEFSHYEEVPTHVTQQVVAAARAARENG